MSLRGQRLEEEVAERRDESLAGQVPEPPEQVLGSSTRDAGAPSRGRAPANRASDVLGLQPAHVLALQRTAGNRAVQRMLDGRASLLRQSTTDAGASIPDAGAPVTTTDAGAPSPDAGASAPDAGAPVTPMPGPRAGLTILDELDRIHTSMAAAGNPTKIAEGSGFRTIDDQIKIYARGRTFSQLKSALAAAVTAGSVVDVKATEWTDYYDPAPGKGNHPMPAGQPGPVTWTLTSRHLTGDAADVVHQTLGWGAPQPFWDALKAAAVAEGLQIGPPANDQAHVQRP